MLAPDTRQHRRCQAGKPVIDLSEFLEPLLTMLGQQFAARVAGSLLNAIGLPELITHSEPEYEALILELARDRQKLQALKCRLSSNRLTQPLFDTKRYTRNFENGLRIAVDRYRQGMAPQDIFIQEEMD
jgi:predicted O-linked N-acetylglucosamine transferase (SPINDLY family)